MTYVFGTDGGSVIETDWTEGWTPCDGWNIHVGFTVVACSQQNGKGRLDREGRGVGPYRSETPTSSTFSFLTTS